MAAAAILAAVWRERRRARGLVAFLRWSRLGRIETARPSGAREWNRVAFVAVSALCCACAVMSAVNDQATAVDEDRRPDLVIALDTSKSMYAADIKPTRIHEAVRQLHLVMRRASVGRIAIVGFAGAAAIICPLTDDREAASAFLDQLEREPVGGRGSDLGLGLRRAADAFGSVRGERVVLLVSDGEVTGAPVDAAIARIREEGLRVFTVGVGTIEGAPVPVRPRSAEFQRDPADPKQAARTSLNQDMLANIAKQGGGTYLRLRVDGDLSSTLEPVWSRMPLRPEDSTAELLPARLLLVIGAGGARDRHRTAHASKSRGAARVTFRTPLLVALGLLVVVAIGARLAVRPLIVKGNAALGRNDVATAERSYRQALDRRPTSAAAYLGLGLATSRQHRYGEAVQDFDRADRLLTSASDRARTNFNRGNAFFALGKLDDALEAYKTALRLDPSDEDARYNLALVMRLRENETSSGGRSMSLRNAEQLVSSMGPLRMRASGTSESSRARPCSWWRPHTCRQIELAHHLSQRPSDISAGRAVRRTR